MRIYLSEALHDSRLTEIHSYNYSVNSLCQQLDKNQYTSKQVNVEKYITDFSNYSFKVFYDEYYNKSLFSNEVKYKENGATVTDFIAKANCYYFDGRYKEIKKLIRKNKKTYNLIMENSSGYIKSILEVESKNQHELTVKK